MTIYAICGPIGSKIKQFAEQLAEYIDIKNVLLIDESSCILKDSGQNNRLDIDSILKKIKETDGDIIVFGHHIFVDEKLRGKLDNKIFIETPADTLLSNYIREGVSTKSLSELLNTYETAIRLINNNEILPTKKFSDLVIQDYPATDAVFNLLKSSSKRVLDDMNADTLRSDGIIESRNPGFFG